MNSDEFARAAARPIWQNDVAEFSSTLFFSKVEFVLVFEKFGKIEEFRNEFSDIGVVSRRSRKPRFFDWMKHSIRQVEMAALKSQEEICKWLWADQKWRNWKRKFNPCGLSDQLVVR